MRWKAENKLYITIAVAPSSFHTISVSKAEPPIRVKNVAGKGINIAPLVPHLHSFVSHYLCDYLVLLRLVHL